MDYQQFGELSPALDKTAANKGCVKRDHVQRIEMASPARAAPVGRQPYSTLLACSKRQQMRPGLSRGQ